MRQGFIVEDHQAAQRWLTSVLWQAFPGIEVLVCDSIEEAHKLLDSQTFDIALIDLNLPDGSGVEIIEKLNQLSPATHTIVTTIYDDDEHIFPALKAGANGYLLKEQSQKQLVKLLKGIINGEPPLSPSISQRLLNFFNTQPIVDAQKEERALTKREQDVLHYIAKGFKLDDVATELNLSRNTIATHVKNIYSKLQISTPAEAAIAATRLGIINNDPKSE